MKQKLLFSLIIFLIGKCCAQQFPFYNFPQQQIQAFAVPHFIRQQQFPIINFPTKDFSPVGFSSVSSDGGRSYRSGAHYFSSASSTQVIL